MAKQHLQPNTNGKLNLEDLLLDNVEITCESLGLGTFGKVSKAYYYGSPCAAKEFHNSWTSILSFDLKGNPKTQPTWEFMEECQQCVKLRHPNVVQFFGVFYKGWNGEGSAAAGSIPGPVLQLVMEKMGDILTTFLAENPHIEMSCKLSILLDIVQGLVYLHSRNPKIVYGGLTSNDVFLTDSVRPLAKIKGNPKIHCFLKKHSAIKPHDKALSEFLPYGTSRNYLHPSLDVFCYGGIMLHTLIQEWPKPSAMLSHSGLKSSSGGKLIIEIERRMTFIKKVGDGILKTLIMSCLDDNADTRPSVVRVQEMIKNAISHLEQTAARTKSPAASDKIIQKEKKLSKKKTTKQNDKESQQKVKEKDIEIQQRDEIIQEKDKEIEQKNKLIQEKENDIMQKENEIDAKNKEIQEKNDLIKCMHNKLDETENELRFNLQNTKSASVPQHTELQNNSGLQCTAQIGDKTSHNQIEPLDNRSEAEALMKRNNNEQKFNLDENGQSIKRAKMPSNGTTVEKQKEVDLLPAINKCQIDNLSNCVIVSKPVSVTVTLRNIQDKPIINCGDSIRVLIQLNKQRNVTTLHPKIQEFDNGQYIVTFVINEDGEYKLVICVGNEKIIEPPYRIRCIPYPLQAECDSETRVIKPLQNATSTSCYFNSVLQVLNQTTGFVEMVLKCSRGDERTYKLPYKNDDNGVDMECPITLSGCEEDTFLHVMNNFLKDVEFDTSQVIQPDYVLLRLTVNSRQERFGQNTQEDSHELLRYLLYEMKKEETDLIKDGVYNFFGTDSQYASNPLIKKQDKIVIKSVLRTASKATVPIDEVFGGVKLNSVICRECDTPLQTEEPFFDISLGVPEMKQKAAVAYSSSGGFGRGSRGRGQYTGQYTFHGHSYDYPNTSYATLSYGSQNNGGRGGRRGGGRRGGGKKPKVYDTKSVQQLLVLNKMFYQPFPDNITSNIDALDDVQTSLVDHTEIDNMDEDNKFICKNCTEREGVDLCNSY